MAVIQEELKSDEDGGNRERRMAAINRWGDKVFSGLPTKLEVESKTVEDFLNDEPDENVNPADASAEGVDGTSLDPETTDEEPT